ncbi:MAG TPA: NAD(P)-dependent oxidoreductase [Thermomicrobiales bacterium]|nr:NAD(P)-dependent oxidoreductase [Thermomicrobiales bacterium]
MNQQDRHLVTGGAGFYGINMVRYLLARGHDVTSLDLAPFDYPERDRVRAVTGDIRDVRALDEAMEDATLVIHAAAALPRHSPADIYTTDVIGTRNVLATAARHGVERVVHISSTAVYGIPDHHPLLETDRLHGVGPYGEAKIAAEEACLDYRRRGMTVPILRPKTFVGPARLGVFAMLCEWAHDGYRFPIIGAGDNRYQLLDVEDLCEATYLACALPPERANYTFNIGAAEFTTLREDFQAVLDRAGHGKQIVGLRPKAAVVLALQALEKVGLSPLYEWVYRTMPEDSFVSIDLAREQLGFTPRYSNKDALTRMYDWYVASMHEFEGTSGVSHRVPWDQGALKLGKLVFR